MLCHGPGCWLQIVGRVHTFWRDAQAVGRVALFGPIVDGIVPCTGNRQDNSSTPSGEVVS